MAMIALGTRPEQLSYNPYTNIVRFAVEDVAVCHALLASASTIWGSMCRISTLAQSTAHKLKAIQVISRRLKEEAPPSELTIVAVILLWTHEVKQPNTCRSERS